VVLERFAGLPVKVKRGGVRALYYYDGEQIVLLVTLFKKAVKENIDASEKEELRKLIKELFGD